MIVDGLTTALDALAAADLHALTDSELTEADGDLAGIAQQLVTFAVGHGHAELDDLVHAFLGRGAARAG
ncbi:hypothetical protein ACI8AF_08360 [Blastococcus sp. SYSU D00669]